MTTRPIDRGARTAVVVPGAALFAGLVVAAAVLGPTLPARIAQHFGGDGQPDGYGSPWPFFWVTAAVAAAAVAMSLWALRARDRRTAGLVVLVGNLLTGILVVTWVWLAVIAQDPEPTFSGWSTVPALLVGGVAGVVPLVVLRRAAAPIERGSAEPLRVGPDARVAWRGRTGSAAFGVIGVLVLATGSTVAVLLGVRGETGGAVTTAVVAVVAGASALLLARVEVTVDRRGLRVVSALTRVPLMRVPLERIDTCGWEQVSPGQWGGWGYRVSGRGVAYVARSGPGLVVETTGGSARLVTVDGADRAAAALGTLLAARAA